jgi:hypothetical protein
VSGEVANNPLVPDLNVLVGQGNSSKRSRAFLISAEMLGHRFTIVAQVPSRGKGMRRKLAP